MTPKSETLREICFRLGMPTEQIRSVAVTEREEGEDYAAFEIVAIRGASLPEWAVKRIFDEYGRFNPAIREILESEGFDVGKLQEDSAA